MVTRGRLAFVASVGIAVGILVVAPSCGSGFLDGLSGGKRDTGADLDTSVDAGTEDARACSLRRIPGPPPDTMNGEQPGTVVLAIDGFRVDDNDRVDAAVGPSVGFDIDNACTCPEPESCDPPPDSGPKKCDGDGGSDNALGGLFSTLSSFLPAAFGPDFATTRIREGAYGGLMSIGGWNREANDRQVFVSFYLSQGTEPLVDGGSGALRLDGTDVWSIDPESIVNGSSNIGANCETELTKCLPVSATNDAYIVDNTLVARIDAPLAISASTGRIVIKMEEVVITAKLRKDGDRYRAEGEFVGRWPVNRVLRALAEVPVDDTPICDQPPLIAVAKSNVCTGVDIMAKAIEDHTGKRCDSISAAFRFTGGSAKLGHIRAPDIPAPSCQSFSETCD